MADDTATVPEDDNITVDVLANDSDSDGTLDRSSLKTVSQPANGSASVNTAIGTITYTPNANFNGNDSFQYRICDNKASCAKATVFITVTPVYDPAIAVDDPLPATDEDTDVNIDVLANDINIDGGPLSVAAVTAPINGGSVSVRADETVTYSPLLNFAGVDVFTYTLDDGTTTDSAVVTVTVRGVNDPPVAVDDAITMIEDVPQFIDVRDNDLDPDTPISQLTVINVTNPTSGTAIIELPGVRYSPDANFNGDDTFSYTITDGEFSDTATVNVTVLPVNDPPVAVDDEITTTPNTAVTILVLSNDSDPEGLDLTSVEVITAPISGTATVIPVAGQVEYTPNPGTSGEDAFVYKVCDTNDPTPICDTATVTVTVASSVTSQPIAAPGGPDATCPDGVTNCSEAEGTANDPEAEALPSQRKGNHGPSDPTK